MKQEFLSALLQEHYPSGRTRELSLVQNRWGKPHLLLDGAPGPGVSFSWSAGAWWAALGTTSSWIGLDAASPYEFTGAYPVHKVFRTGEWQAATSLTGGDREEAAALLWSAKEAVVKARGCGYHFCGPRQIRVESTGKGDHGPCWRGYLEAPGPDPAPWGSQEVLAVASIRLHQVWLSVAWMRLAAPKTPAPGG
ncbi:MAG: 4'-phosphopantetheinyl transferase family protein [Thermodesulfobacteriota bacterium]